MILAPPPIDVLPRATAQLFVIPQVPFDLDPERPIIVLEGGEFFELVSLLVAGREQLAGAPVPCSWLAPESDWRFISRPFDVCQPWQQVSVQLVNVTDNQHHLAAEFHGERYEEPF